MELRLVKTHRLDKRGTGRKQVVVHREVRADVARVPVALLELAARVAECAWAAAE